MDMYQKREIRKKKAQTKNNEESTKQMNINWYIGSYSKITSNPYK